MMTLAAIAAAITLGLFAFLWIVRLVVNRSVADQVSASLKGAHQDFLALAEQRLATERAQHLGELESRKRDVEKSVEGLEVHLTRYEQLMRQMENDRSTKYGALEAQLTSTQKETQKLAQTTQQLASMLGNAKVRGQWGEKTAEDILNICGLREGIHYEKQRNAPLGRPDFTFRLPDKHACYMDVKFPLDNYVKFFNSEREEDRKAHKEQFLKDLRIHLRALEKRDYAAAAGADPDYVLMFIPNEQVYAAVNEWMPGLIDEALAKRIIVSGPWTLYAQVRLMWQAWQSYYQAQTLGEIVNTVSDFLKTYQLFKERMLQLGETLEAASAKYREVTQTSFTQLERKIDRIERYRLGQQLDVAAVVQEPSADNPVAEKESTHA